MLFRDAKTGRAWACVFTTLVAVDTLALSSLQGCSLIGLDAFDYSDASHAASPDAADATADASDAAASEEAGEVTEDDSPEASDDDVTESADDTGADSQGGGSADVTSPSEAGDARGSGNTPDGGGDATADTGAAPPKPCASNVLAPKTAVASSFQPAGPGTIALPASYAIDNDFTTRWGSALEVDPSWIYMDFGASVFVSEVDLIWQNACGTDYEIDVSTDATHWTMMKTVAGNTVGTAVPTNMAWGATQALKYPGLSGRGRYVRIYGTARCLAMYGYSIWEMRAIGDTNSTCSP